MTQEKNGTPPSGRTLGYGRVRTPEQELRMQVAALQAQGCPDEVICVDTASGAKAARPGLPRCLATLQAGALLLVWRLDRLGRSMAHLVTLVADLQERGVGFRSLCAGAIDTTPASGELVFNIFSARAQFERRLLQDRPRAGLAAARARGRQGGRPTLDPPAPRVQMTKALYKARAHEGGGGDLSDAPSLPVHVVSLSGPAGRRAETAWGDSLGAAPRWGAPGAAQYSDA